MASKALIYKLNQLELTIGYAFEDIELLDLALTHKSYGPKHNERLEFLGDAVLETIISDELYQRFPSSTEGELTRMRSNLVRESSLANIARTFKIPNYLKMGQGMMKSGGSKIESIIADTVESTIAAIYIDSKRDYVRTSRIVLQWFAQALEEVNPKVNNKDAKSYLQELLQAKGNSLPVYTTDRMEGPSNDQTFYVSVTIAGHKQKFEGVAKSRRGAEQIAAQKALDFIKS